MTDHDKLLKLDDLILELEISQEKACVMASNIDQEYFDLSEDSHKLHYFNHYGIEFDILFDYVCRIGDQLEEIRKLLNEE